METADGEKVRAELESRLGKKAADELLKMVGLSTEEAAQRVAGRYRLAIIDMDAALPDCPFIAEAKALEERFREEADEGTRQETHAVYDLSLIHI